MRVTSEIWTPVGRAGLACQSETLLSAPEVWFCETAGTTHGCNAYRVSRGDQITSTRGTRRFRKYNLS